MSLRLAFMGTPDFAVPTLAELIGASQDIACVYTQPPRRKGRGLAEEKSPVHKFADAAELPVRVPPSLKDAEEQAAFAALGLDAAIVVAYGVLLPKAILAAPRRLSVNAGDILRRAGQFGERRHREVRRPHEGQAQAHGISLTRRLTRLGASAWPICARRWSV